MRTDAFVRETNGGANIETKHAGVLELWAAYVGATTFWREGDALLIEEINDGEALQIVNPRIGVDRLGGKITTRKPSGRA